MIARDLHIATSTFAVVALTYSTTLAASDEIEVRQLDAIVRKNPLTDGATAAIIDSIRAGGAEMNVLVMSKNRLHHHAHQDHVLFLVRGNGTAKLENDKGQVETRAIRPGDIFRLPRGKKHGFEKSGNDDLIFLVVATQLPPGVEETTYHE